MTTVFAGQLSLDYPVCRVPCEFLTGGGGDKGATQPQALLFVHTTQTDFERSQVSPGMLPIFS